jgi:predicted glycosyltransferase
MRVLILVTHLLGVGHLARAAALGRAFAQGGHDVALVSGGRAAPQVSTAGLRLIQLPSLHVKGVDFATLFDDEGAPACAALLDRRKAMLAKVLAEFRPDAALVELFPFGRRQLAAEHMEFHISMKDFHTGDDAFSHGLHVKDAPRFLRRAFVACSIRDVLNPPSKSSKATFAEETLAQHFDTVLVHGDPGVLPLEASWPVTPGLARRLQYTGYVRDAGDGSVRPALADHLGEVLVSGGGSMASLPLMRAALAAAALDGSRSWRLLVGHGVPERDFAALASETSPNATVERVRPDFPGLLAGCACSVSQAGYNTMLDLNAAKCPAVVVPFDDGNEIEQGIRAERFERMGLCRLVRASSLSGPALLEAVRGAMANGRSPSPHPSPPLHRGEGAGQSGGEGTALTPMRPAATLDVSGAKTTVRLVEQGVEEKRRLAESWRAIKSDLDALAGQGRSLSFWWRDDDATEVTPALERLLDLRGRLGVPLSLAVIPGQARAELAARLAVEGEVDVLVHGVDHRNNAGPGMKKQELLGVEDATVEALARGRARLATLFGDRALPVLVPPWNRIEEGLLSKLASAGLYGLSTFGENPSGAIIQTVNTHIDPIDWRGGGGLVRAPTHIAALAGAVRLCVSKGPDAAPVGLLTHHLVHDPWVWSYVEDLLEWLKSQGSVRFVSARQAFGLTTFDGQAGKVDKRR